jgi:hypothetical protein
MTYGTDAALRVRTLSLAAQNESTDSPTEVLQPFIDRGLVTLLPWPGKARQRQQIEDCFQRSVDVLKPPPRSCATKANDGDIGREGAFSSSSQF